MDDIDRWIQNCDASKGTEGFQVHTCGLDYTLYFQGNRHTHDGESCEDWAHCSSTSDEQRRLI